MLRAIVHRYHSDKQSICWLKNKVAFYKSTNNAPNGAIPALLRWPICQCYNLTHYQPYAKHLMYLDNLHLHRIFNPDVFNINTIIFVADAGIYQDEIYS